MFHVRLLSSCPAHIGLARMIWISDNRMYDDICDMVQTVIGRTIQGYEIREQLKVGGHGVIYLAHEGIVNRETA